MIHNRAGRKLKRTASHRKALLGNLATSLFKHKRIITTEAKAKELRRFAEPLITRAKHALANEKNGRLTAGQKIDIHNRRIVGRTIREKGVLQDLFDTIAPSVEHRNGGYLRIVKLGQRRGDSGRMASIELVDFYEAVLPAKKKKKVPARVPAAPKPVAHVAAPTPTPVEQPAAAEEATTPEIEAASVEPAATDVAAVAPTIVEEPAVEVETAPEAAADETVASEIESAAAENSTEETAQAEETTTDTPAAESSTKVESDSAGNEEPPAADEDNQPA